MKIVRRILFIIPALAGAVAMIIASLNKDIAENIFANGISRFLSDTVGGAVAAVPFSVTEAMIFIFIIFVVFCIVMMILRKMKFLHFLEAVLWTVSIGFMLYAFTHGVNFYRYTFSELSGIEEKTADADTLYELCVYAADKAEDERSLCKTDENGCFTLSSDIADVLSDMSGYDNIYGKYPFLAGSVDRVKSVAVSHLWSYTGITGMYFPLWSECNANTDVPDFTIPHTACHEIAHSRRFAREDECNFIGFIACINSDSADFRYSGWIFCFRMLARELYSADSDLYAELYEQHVSVGIKRDLAQNSAYWDGFDGIVQDISTAVNNAFITSQGVSEGVKSYSKCSKLMISYLLQ